MSRAEKKAAKSTKRDPSGFEIVEEVIETRKKAAVKRITAKQPTRGQGSRGGGRGGRGGRGRGRGGARKTTIAAKAKAISQSIEVSSDSEDSEDEESDDGFGDLEGSDEDFHESKHGDGDDNDEWMYD